jgi:hypothetical protein
LLGGESMRAVACLRKTLFMSAAFVALTLPRSARADEVDACANAYEAAQRLHQKSDPKAVSEAATCARDVCPDVLRKECSAWVKEWAPSEKTVSKSEPAPTPVEHDAPKLEEPSRPIPLLAYVLAGGGVAALGVAGGFAISGMNTRSDLQRAGCEPNCPSTEVDSARRSFLIADVFGIAGVAALGGALAVYLMRPEAKAASGRPRVQITPLFAGAAVRGTF